MEHSVATAATFLRAFLPRLSLRRNTASIMKIFTILLSYCNVHCLVCSYAEAPALKLIAIFQRVASVLMFAI